MHDYGLNDEQLSAILAPSPSMINASAGSGKTRCLIAKIRYLLDQGASPASILAITFTNKAAKEMKGRLRQFYPNVQEMQVSTIHSMCVRIIRRFVHHTPLKSPFSIYDDGDQTSVMKTLIKARALKLDPGEVLSSIGVAKSRGEKGMLGVFGDLYKAYQEIMIANNACDFDDLLIYAADCLKQEDCRHYYTQRWRHILVDEFQDTSAIQYRIIESLYDPPTTRTLFTVGDQNQCAVQGTLIGGSAIETIKKGDNVPAAVGRGICRASKVTSTHAMDVVDRQVVTISTKSGCQVTVTNDHILFAGYVYDADRPIYFTYLMYKKEFGYRVGVTSAHRTRGAYEPVLGFKLRMIQERADMMWLLRACDSPSEAKYYEQLYSIRYGLPTWIFHECKGLRYTKDHIRMLFSELNTEKAARSLLSDLGMFIDHPHHVPKAMSKNRRRNFSITLCGDSRGATPFHRYALSGSDNSDSAVLESIGMPVRSAKNCRGYRVEGLHTQLNAVYDMCNRIRAVLPLNIIEKAHFTNMSLPMIPASHALPGMLCYIENGSKIETDYITDVKHWKYSGRIFDLNVDQVHNYAAGGIIVHNSIYSFRGANPQNMLDFIAKYSPTVRNLTYNYRSCNAVISHANRFLQYGEEMVPKSGIEGKVSFSKFMNHEDEASKIADAIQQMDNYEETAVLYRVNARSLMFERALAMRRIPYKVVGDLPFYRRRVVKDMLSYCKAAANPSDIESLVRIVNVPKRGFGETRQERLLREGRPYIEYMAQEMPQIENLLTVLHDIKSMPPADAIEHVLESTGYKKGLEKESDIAMIDAIVNVATAFPSTEELILASSFLEEDSGKGVKLMTAHASKGLEFNRVFVVGVEEGLWPHSLATDLKEEERLFYVACTRARKYLNISCTLSRMLRGEVIQVQPSHLFHAKG